MTINTKAIRELNDAFRSTFLGGQVMVTIGLRGRPDLTDICRKVMSFDAFCDTNDPHQEHDFGAFEHQRDTVFWKIDYYDPTMRAGSSDPSDASVTHRVLTIMLASEY